MMIRNHIPELHEMFCGLISDMRLRLLKKILALEGKKRFFGT